MWGPSITVYITYLVRDAIQKAKGRICHMRVMFDNQHPGECKGWQWQTNKLSLSQRNKFEGAGGRETVAQARSIMRICGRQMGYPLLPTPCIPRDGWCIRKACVCPTTNVIFFDAAGKQSAPDLQDRNSANASHTTCRIARCILLLL